MVTASNRSGIIELRQLRDLDAEVFNDNLVLDQNFGHLCISISNVVKAKKSLLLRYGKFKKKLGNGSETLENYYTMADYFNYRKNKTNVGFSHITVSCNNKKRFSKEMVNKSGKKNWL